jgi:hypothetical protein
MGCLERGICSNIYAGPCNGVGYCNDIRFL